jgi:hypothetical protein
MDYVHEVEEVATDCTACHEFLTSYIKNYEDELLKLDDTLAKLHALGNDLKEFTNKIK